MSDGVKSIFLEPGYSMSSKLRNKSMVQMLEHLARSLENGDFFFISSTVTPFDSTDCTRSEAFEKCEEKINSLTTKIVESCEAGFVLLNVEIHRAGKNKPKKSNLSKNVAEVSYAVSRLIQVPDDITEPNSPLFGYPHFNIILGIPKGKLMQNPGLINNFKEVLRNEIDYRNQYVELLSDFKYFSIKHKSLVNSLKYNVKEYLRRDLKNNINLYFKKKSACFLHVTKNNLYHFGEFIKYFA
jgi:hypothetical protein